MLFVSALYAEIGKDMNKQNTKKKENTATNRLMEFAKRHSQEFGLSMFFAILGVAAGMVPYVGVAQIIKKLVEGCREENIYLKWCFICLAGFAGRAIFMGVSTSISHTATYQTLREIREELLRKLSRCPMGYLLEKPSGELKNIVIEKVESMERFLAHMIPELTAYLAVPVFLIVYVFIVDWRMGLVTFITTPIAIVCCCGMLIGYEEKFNGFMNAGKRMSSVVVEYIKGIEVIKTFHQTGSAYKKYTEAVNDNAKYALNWMKGTQLFMSMTLTIMPAILISVLPIGMIFYTNDSLSATDFLTVIVVGMGIMGPLLSVMKYSDAMTQIESQMGDICKVLDVPELKRSESNTELKNGKVVMEHVSFSYNEDVTEENMVLKDVNLVIEPGTMTALVGPSGGGKSTIGKLIAGFWDVNSGKITIDGTELSQLSQEQIANSIAYVAQDNFLFNDTIMENIRIGRQGASDEEVIAIAKACGCHEFIMQLENGYETVAGDMGGHLSGGERQRVAIARAMLKDAPIVILDEATAFADPENEAAIQNAVGQLIKDKTVIVIAHRLGTVVNADNIIVVKSGSICETGTHEQLLKSGKTYGSLWSAYCGN